MMDRDEVIRQVCMAGANGATGVRRALDEWLSSGCKEGPAATLRAELVALVAGHEAVSHDGATFDVRQAAARAALDAWDGECVEEPKLGVRARKTTWALLWRQSWGQDSLMELVLRGVLATGQRDDTAVLWAIDECARATERRRDRAVTEALANSIRRVADVLESETAQAFVARLPERMRGYVETALRSRG